MVAAGLIGGCASRAPIQRAATADHHAAFAAGDYDRASLLAAAIPAPDEATRLVEGLAYEAAGRDDEAEAQLRPLSRSATREIRGRANAGLGLIALRQGNEGEARRLLTRASRELAGSDGAWAAHYAITAGAPAETGDLGRRASAASRALATAGNPTGQMGGYAIQFGSFSSEARAQRHAQAVSRLTRPAGVASPEISPITRGARTLFAVRSGGYATKAAASNAAASLDTDTAVVTLR